MGSDDSRQKIIERMSKKSPNNHNSNKKIEVVGDSILVVYNPEETEEKDNKYKSKSEK